MGTGSQRDLGEAKMKMKARSILTCVLLFGMVVLGAVDNATAGAILSPTSGTINSGGPGFGSLDDTFNHSGLITDFISGVTDFDEYLALDPIHVFEADGNEWFSELEITSASVTYDLGAAKNIDRLALWNEDASGIGALSLFTSTDNVTFTLLTSVVPTDNTLNVDYPADVFSFGTVTAQYIRFDMSGCPQAPSILNACAIGEVAFREVDGVSVPEPGTVVLLGIGIAGLAGVHFTYFKAISLTNVATAILLEYLAPVIVLLVSVIFLHHRFTWALPIGVGLSVITATAYYDGCQMLLFLDQDTGFTSGTLEYIKEFRSAYSRETLEKYVAVVFDAKRKAVSSAFEVEDALLAISSGSLFLLDNLKKIGWHNPTYFVDGVDLPQCECR
jgi:hypothetical protein